MIENRDAFEVIKQHDAEYTLFYADPPYLPSVRISTYEMTEEDHIKLAATLNGVKGKVIMSGYNSPLYDELYKGWVKREKADYADGMLPRTEVLWMKGIKADLFEEEI